MAAASRNKGRVEMECGLVLGGAMGEMDSMILGMAMATTKRENVRSDSCLYFYFLSNYIIYICHHIKGSYLFNFIFILLTLNAFLS